MVDHPDTRETFTEEEFRKLAEAIERDDWINATRTAAMLRFAADALSSDTGRLRALVEKWKHKAVVAREQSVVLYGSKAYEDARYVRGMADARDLDADELARALPAIQVSGPRETGSSDAPTATSGDGSSGPESETNAALLNMLTAAIGWLGGVSLSGRGGRAVRHQRERREHLKTLRACREELGMRFLSQRLEIGLPAAPSAGAETCEWKQSAVAEYASTACGEVCVLRLVGASWCCYCGRPLREVPVND